MSGFRRSGLLTLVALGLTATGCATQVDVGAVISEHGAGAVYGEKVKKGLDLALDEINEAGGIRGRPARLIYRDDESNPDIGRQVTSELIEEHDVKIIIGAVTSKVTLAIAPICEKERVVLLSPTASAPQITDAGAYIFRNYPSDILEGTSMADFARDLGLARVVIFSVADEYGAGLKEVFTLKYENPYREVVEVFEFDDAQPETFGEMVEQAKELDPDGIYIIGYVNPMAQLLKLIQAAGLRTVVMGTGSVTEDIVKLAGSAAEHLVYPQQPFDPQSREPQQREFIDAYQSRYNEVPDTWAAHGYDALKLIALAIERGGSAQPDSVRGGLSSIDNYRGASGDAGFDNNGDVVQYPRLFIIHQGESMPYERFLEQGASLTITGRS